MRDQQTIKHHKVDHPSRDPRREKAERIGKKRMEKMQFESEGAKNDYVRAVRANPRNVMGYPRNLLFPLVKVKALSISDIPEPTEEELEKMVEDKRVLASVQDFVSRCRFCEKETPHQKWNGQVEFCKKCGNTTVKLQQGETR